ncbi:hypothetical protein DFH29DRAFT_880728 [Suillus ampliporus]|nr:hypothetical protein DFH29DRAFT_880728 [Suillus ampliporus]
MELAITSLTKQVKESTQHNGYKAALLTDLGDNNSQTIQRAARETIKTRQILVNLSPESPLAPGKVSHAQLVDKIKTVLKALKKENTPTLEIRAVTQYHNGNTVIEMMMAEGAAYLRRDNTKMDFIKALDPSATIKDQTYPVVLQFIPIQFAPEDDEHLRDLECQNKWESGTITSARWIKTAGKQANDQQVAHLIATLHNPNTANLGIHDGITWNQTRIQLKKNKMRANPLHQMSILWSHSQRMHLTRRHLRELLRSAQNQQMQQKKPPLLHPLQNGRPLQLGQKLPCIRKEM